jgi:hypothetical protein
MGNLAQHSATSPSAPSSCQGTALHGDTAGDERQQPVRLRRRHGEPMTTV